MSVPVTTASTFTFGKPGKLFGGPYMFGPVGRTYDASDDGQRFLMIKPNIGAADSRTVRRIRDRAELV